MSTDTPTSGDIVLTETFSAALAGYPKVWRDRLLADLRACCQDSPRYAAVPEPATGESFAELFYAGIPLHADASVPDGHVRIVNEATEQAAGWVTSWTAARCAAHDKAWNECPTCAITNGSLWILPDRPPIPFPDPAPDVIEHPDDGHAWRSIPGADAPLVEDGRMHRPGEPDIRLTLGGVPAPPAIGPDHEAAFRSGWNAARASMGAPVAEALRETAVGEWGKR